VATLAPRASAQAPQRTFVASYGNDLNAGCARTTPCRNFQTAVDAVLAGGEVVALDSAGYGPFTVAKSVTVTSEGIHAAITAVTGGNGITVTAGAEDRVILRNLRLIGATGALVGIDMAAGAALHVEGVVVEGPFQTGISAHFDGEAFVKDTIVRDVTVGIAVGLGTVGTLEHVKAENGTTGVEVKVGASATARDSIASGNTGTGFRALGAFDAGPPGVLHLERCLSSSNGTGVSAGSGATVYVSASAVVGNTTGLAAGIPALAGSIVSFGNNTLAENATPGAFTSTVAQQ
jgi:hypothetical protein